MRGEDCVSPDAVDDRGDRGEQVDGVRDGLGQPGGRVVGDEQRDPHGERHGEHQRDDRDDHRCPEQRGHTEPKITRCRCPLGRGQEVDLVVQDRRHRLDGEEDRDQDDQDHDEPRGAGRGPLEHAVAPPDLSLGRPQSDRTGAEDGWTVSDDADREGLVRGDEVAILGRDRRGTGIGSGDVAADPARDDRLAPDRRWWRVAPGGRLGLVGHDVSVAHTAPTPRRAALPRPVAGSTRRWRGSAFKRCCANRTDD